MKAMILAAGLGTRLRPLTDHCPKALVELNGHTLLEITLRRLSVFGILDVVINVHHLGDMIVDYLKANQNFGLRVEISREEVLLDTGGGLKQAAWFFLKDPARLDEPFVLHNVDVLSNIDLQCMADAHVKERALATLAVRKRDSSRQLLFDEQLRLCGRRAGRDGASEIVRSWSPLEPLAFSGIHMISPRLLPMLTEKGGFPIIPSYLRLAAQRENIRGFRTDNYYWRDLGKPGDLSQAAIDLESPGMGR